MAKFNLKKSKNKAPAQVENRLIDSNEKLDNESIDDSGSMAYRLQDNHKKSEGDRSLQKLMEEKRVENDGLEITEVAINNTKVTINDMKFRNDDMDKTPLMDYGKKDSDSDKFVTDKEKRDTSFWDGSNGGSDGFETTKIMRNRANSQLVSNYKDREEFEKTQKMASIQELSDADALLFSVYKKAASEGREILTKEEEQIVTDINSSKIRILRK